MKLKSFAAHFAAVLLFAPSLQTKAADPAKPIASVEELRIQRKQAAERKRRIIFNNDGNEPVYLCTNTTPEELLKHRTAALAGSQVDSLFYCTWSSGFGLFTHGTKKGQVLSTKEDLFAKNRTEELLAAGTDPLRVMTDFGHRNNMEVFWSFRLNDTHDGSTASYGPVMFRANKLKQEHPEWLFSTADKRPKFGAWSAVDFTRDEIRNLAFQYVEEVCQNYDVDGVELDFFRHPVFFKRAALTGTECNDEERALMTDLLRRIRTMTEVEGMKRGRPFLMAIRVPDSVDFCRAVGIDLEKWLEEGLIDLLIASGYFQLNDWSYSVNLGRKHGVKVYPSMDESRVKDPDSHKLRRSVGTYRGRALNAWQAGMDGIYLFNAFNPASPMWRELGDAQTLAAMDQDYFASVRGLGAAAGGTYPHLPFLRVPDLNPNRPLTLQPKEESRIPFQAGADLSSLTAEQQPKISLRLRFKSPVKPEMLEVKLNGKKVPFTAASDDWLEYEVPPALLRVGSNETIILPTVKAVVLTDLHCSLRFPTPKK